MSLPVADVGTSDGDDDEGDPREDVYDYDYPPPVRDRFPVVTERELAAQVGRAPGARQSVRQSVPTPSSDDGRASDGAGGSGSGSGSATNRALAKARSKLEVARVATALKANRQERRPATSAPPRPVWEWANVGAAERKLRLLDILGRTATAEFTEKALRELVKTKIGWSIVSNDLDGLVREGSLRRTQGGRTQGGGPAAWALVVDE